jgi:hypothetical protein
VGGPASSPGAGLPLFPAGFVAGKGYDL